MNDYSLLRPFDVEAAKRGEAVIWGLSHEDISFVARSMSGKTNIIERQHGKDTYSVAYARDSDLRMKPLAFVEGKPVYKGDVLYWKSGVEPHVVTAVFSCDGESHLVMKDDSTYAASVLTWTKPKRKVEKFGVMNKTSGFVITWKDSLADAQKCFANGNYGIDLYCIIFATWEE